jgi:Zinc-finger associated domain (zf-AD)
MKPEFDKTCRCCLKEFKKTGLKNLHQDHFGSATLIECYKTCSGIVDESNFKNICTKCTKTLKTAYKFRQLCQSSHQKFLDTSGKDDVKEEFPLVEIYPEIDQIKHEILSDDEKAEDDKTMDEVIVKNEQPLKSEETDESDQEMDDRDGDTQMEVDDGEEEQQGDDDDNSKTTDTEDASTMNSYLLKGHFVCDACDAAFENCRDLNAHKKNHIWVRTTVKGLVFIQICP